MMKGAIIMRDLYWLSENQLKVITPYFPTSRGVERIDDLRVIRGIIFVIKRGLQWRDAPTEYGSYTTLYKRFIRWSHLGVFDKIFDALARQVDPPDPL